jgi:hypothetical protein
MKRFWMNAAVALVGVAVVGLGELHAQANMRRGGGGGGGGSGFKPSPSVRPNGGSEFPRPNNTVRPPSTTNWPQYRPSNNDYTPLRPSNNYYPQYRPSNNDYTPSSPSYTPSQPQYTESAKQPSGGGLGLTDAEAIGQQIANDYPDATPEEKGDLVAEALIKYNNGNPPPASELGQAMGQAIPPPAPATDVAAGIKSADQKVQNDLGVGPLTNNGLGVALANAGITKPSDLVAATAVLAPPGATQQDVKDILKGAGVNSPTAQNLLAGKVLDKINQNNVVVNNNNNGGGVDNGGGVVPPDGTGNGGNSDVGGGSDQGGDDAVAQTRRYLRVKNATGQRIKVWVQYRTMNDQEQWQWYPADPARAKRGVSFDFEPGEESLVEHNGQRIDGSRVRLWAQAKDGSRWDEYKDKDLWLVSEVDRDGSHTYYAPQIGTYTFTFNP